MRFDIVAVGGQNQNVEDMAELGPPATLAEFEVDLFETKFRALSYRVTERLVIDLRLIILVGHRTTVIPDFPSSCFLDC